MTQSNKPPSVLVIVPFHLDEEELDLRRQQSVSEAGLPLRLEYRSVKAGPISYNSPLDWTFLDMAVLEAGLGADEDFDGVLVDTVSDAGVDALRSALSVPVFGAGRTSLMYAAGLGSRVGVLAQWGPSLLRYEKVAREWQLPRPLLVEHFDASPDYANLLEGKLDDVLPAMADACKRLEQRGADVICLGSTTMHQAYSQLRALLDVPLINPGPLSYRWIATSLALGLTHSKRAHPCPFVARDEFIHQMFKQKPPR